jgi:hypothetical protein
MIAVLAQEWCCSHEGQHAEHADARHRADSAHVRVIRPAALAWRGNMELAGTPHREQPAIPLQGPGAVGHGTVAQPAAARPLAPASLIWRPSCSPRAYRPHAWQVGTLHAHNHLLQPGSRCSMQLDPFLIRKTLQVSRTSTRASF